MNRMRQDKTDDRMLIVHIVHRLAIGGLENGIVNLVNRMAEDKYRHVIISLTGISDIAQRIRNKEVVCHALGKKEGIDPMVHFRLWRILVKMKPDIVHTRNLGTLDCQLAAFLALVPKRIHGEHGRDLNDIEGREPKYVLLRRVFRPIVKRYVALSQDTERWLRIQIKVPKQKVMQIYNGVDTDKFSPGMDGVQGERVCFTIGTVGRLQGEKDQLTLVKAFRKVLDHTQQSNTKRVRLVIVGDGPLRDDIERLIKKTEASEQIEMTGSRDDVAKIMRGFDLFVLPSLTEGISNTILEAMATGLPVVATNVGGNPELVVENETGLLVPAADEDALAAAIITYLESPGLLKDHGERARKRVLEKFSLEAMVKNYEGLYEKVMRE